MNNVGRIYVIKNTVNDKVYIGQTKKSLANRFSNHKSAANKGKRYVLYYAMRKYGIDNFYIELLEEVPYEKLNEREIYWIAKYNATNRKYGYNMSSGGNRQDNQAVPLNDKEVLKLFNEGLSARKIAKHYKTEITRITAILKAHNVVYGIDKQRIPLEEEQQMIALYEKGYSATKIGLYMHRDKSTIRKVLLRNGCKLRTFAETKNMERNPPPLFMSAPRESCN